MIHKLVSEVARKIVEMLPKRFLLAFDGPSSNSYPSITDFPIFSIKKTPTSYFSFSVMTMASAPGSSQTMTSTA
jgi:hypothetical protein